MGKVLVACEYSGIVRDAFIAEGHDAISCDLLSTERPGPHIQGDVRSLLQEPWDLVIAHPPCSELTMYTWTFRNPQTLGAKWWRRYHEALAFFVECRNANAPLVAVENPPVMHPRARGVLGRPDCVTDFRFFGGPMRKRVGWWLTGLPPLMGTAETVDAIHVVKDRSPKHRRETSPKPSNFGAYSYSKDRSRFDPGMAAAMAKQWGCFI